MLRIQTRSSALGAFTKSSTRAFSVSRTALADYNSESGSGDRPPRFQRERREPREPREYREGGGAPRFNRSGPTLGGFANAFSNTFSGRDGNNNGNGNRGDRGNDRNRGGQGQDQNVTVNFTYPPIKPAPSLITLADLTPTQISDLLSASITFKYLSKNDHVRGISLPNELRGKTVALLFSKRSTRTRVASETATQALGGHAMFLGSQDIQLGVNESMEDSIKVISSMADGIMARVGDHSEIEEIAKHSRVPVINALSHLYHPTQILADLMALYETFDPEPIPPQEFRFPVRYHTAFRHVSNSIEPLEKLKGKKIAWVGDVNNILNEIMVTMPRLGMELSVAAPKGYDEVDPKVWARVQAAGTESLITLTNSPSEALKDADIVVTDTWISMGQEDEKAARLAAFEGFQVTEELVNNNGAKKDWKFIHCLPRHKEEVDDEVFYGPRSIVFEEAENRKWTTMACFHYLFGRGQFPQKDSRDFNNIRSRIDRAKITGGVSRTWLKENIVSGSSAPFITTAAAIGRLLKRINGSQSPETIDSREATSEEFRSLLNKLRAGP